MTDPSVTDRDLFLSRTFAAPRSVVWSFWTTPERISRWFGPDAFTVPLDSVRIDLRVGGAWNLSMQDADGTRYPIRGTIVELVEHELLVIRLDADTGVGDLEDISLRVQFHDHGDRTRVTLHQGPFPEEIQRTQTAEGWALSFTKTDAILASLTEGPSHE